MGITNFSVSKLDPIIDNYKPKSVIELGAQQTYVMGERYGQYANWYYDSKGIKSYTAIDLCGENDSLVIDLAYPIKEKIHKCDLLTDFGTQEHIGINGAFAWEAIYNCWLNKHLLLKAGGIMVNENPETKSWPLHGFQWFTKEFYTGLVAIAPYEILDIDTVAAMGNTRDGWNVYCALKKTGSKFPSLEEFKTLDLRRE